jgi:exodeoxyribonuclease VII large subunit
VSQPAFDFDLEPGADAAEPTYSVGELADALNRSLRRDFGDGVWVRGEIQGWSARGPHAYFSLADDSGGDKAVINVQFFAPSRARLKPLLKKSGLELTDGLRVRIFGHLDFYAPNGRIGLKMSGIDPRFTLGELAMARDAVIRRLVAAGAFDANRARPLPAVPLRVGVVTSVGTAAWHDFRHLMERSGLGFRLSVVDTRVQGESAVRAVASSIRTLSARRNLDVIVVIRGGGARSDLSTFDAEDIALAIAAAPVPVFTGLGHEVDRSVADAVAHSSFTTPTACGAELVDTVAAFMATTEHTWTAIDRVARQRVADAGIRLSDRAQRIGRRTHAAVERADDRLEARLQRLRVRAPQVLAEADRHLDRADEQLRRRPVRVLAAEERHLGTVDQQLALLDPAVLLARGWSITCAADGRVVRRPSDAPPGTVVETRLAEGTLTSRVLEPHDPPALEPPAP